MSKTTNLVYKVNGIIAERDQLNTLIFEYINDTNQQHDFYKYLMAIDDHDVKYNTLDVVHMARDYKGYENENKINTTKGDN